MARIAHRIVASTALLVILVLLLQSLAMRPALRREGGLALALLALALFLAVLGRVGAESHAAPVVLGNLLGGLAMFALACRLLQVTGAARLGAAAQLRPWLLGALVLLALQLALGGLASSQQAAGRCTELGACQVHRLLGIAIAVLLAPLGAAAARAGQRIGVAIALLALLQVALGWVLGANASPLAVALAHNVLAVLLLGAVASAVVAPADPLPAVA